VDSLLAANTPNQRLLLVIDQFEELFSQSDRTEHTRFIAALKALGAVETCVLMIAMRGDFYSDLMNSDMWPVEPSQRQEIAPLHGQALRRAIERPASVVGVYLEGGLVERLLADAADEPGILPLVQETMMVLWAKMQRRLLTLSTYERLGGDGRSGLAVAVVSKADATLAALSPDQRALAWRIFLRLVQFGEGRADTRRQQSIAELASVGEATFFDQTLQHLANNRLLTLSGEEKEAGKKVDISHEALITGWPTLHTWITERRDKEKTRRRLEEKAQEWTRLGKSGGFLDAVELAEAEQWLKSPDGADLGCSLDLQALVQASRAAIDKAEQEKEAVRQRELKQAKALADVNASKATMFKRFLYVLGAIALVAVAFAVVAIISWTSADNQSRLAKSRQLAAEANADFYRKSPGSGLALAVQGVNVSPTYEALDKLLQFVQTTSTVEYFLFGHEARVISTVFSADGRYLASRDVGGQMIVWDVKSGKPVGRPLRGDYYMFYMAPEYLAVSPQGLIALLTNSKQLKIWDTASGKLVCNESIKDNMPNLVTGLAFTNQGQWIAISSEDGSVLWWDVSNRIPTVPIKYHDAAVEALVVSKDGNLLATGDAKGRVVIWNLKGEDSIDTTIIDNFEEEVRIDKKSKKVENLAVTGVLGVTSLAFDEDNRFLAWARMDNKIIVFDINKKSQYEVWNMGGHQAPIEGIAFQAKGQDLVSLGRDGIVIEWSLAAPRFKMKSLEKLPWPTSSLHALSVEGKGVTSWGEGNMVLWFTNTRSSLLDRPNLSKPGPTEAVSLSPGGQRIAFILRDGRVIIQDVVEGKPVVDEISPEEEHRVNMAWSTDALLALTTRDGRIPIRDSAAHRWIGDLRGPKEPIQGVIFSPDGKQLATMGRDELFSLWKIAGNSLENLPTPKPLEKPKEHVSAAKLIQTLAFSRKGKLLALGYQGGAVGIWDAGNDRWFAQPVSPYKGSSSITCIVFSPNGKWLASGDRQGQVILWDAEKCKPLGEPQKVFEGQVASLAFSSDRKRVISADDAGNVAVWNVDVESWKKRACQIAQPNLSEEEWKQLMGDQPYPRTCSNTIK
jgi:WD40 repeat protein